jgi:hypothetical protein
MATNWTNEKYKHATTIDVGQWSFGNIDVEKETRGNKNKN